jgi:hypothetical protein
MNSVITQYMTAWNRLLMIDSKCPKHAEFFSKINLRTGASCWFLLYEYLWYWVNEEISYNSSEIIGRSQG